MSGYNIHEVKRELFINAIKRTLIIFGYSINQSTEKKVYKNTKHSDISITLLRKCCQISNLCAVFGYGECDTLAKLSKTFLMKQG